MRAKKNNAERALRGGTYFRGTRNLRVSYPIWDVPVVRDWGIGFRFVIRDKKR